MTRAAVVALAACAACAPELDARPSAIVAPTVIAVSVDPAEAPPGAPVTLTVAVATPDGPGDADDAAWALCRAPRPVTDNNAVPRACVDGAADALAPLPDVGAIVPATISPDACGLFGPSPPPGGFRPRDPDATGGYYQPVRVDVADQVSFGMARVYCMLANAPLPETRRYAAEYVHNVAPAITGFAPPAELAAGADVALEVAWDASARETYLVYDLESKTLVDATERLTVSWYATAGELDVDRTAGDATGSSNTWRAPDAPGSVHLWAVVRDDRGGVSAVAHAVVEVR